MEIPSLCLGQIGGKVLGQQSLGFAASGASNEEGLLRGTVVHANAPH
jgi:hypothetical protein